MSLVPTHLELRDLLRERDALRAESTFGVEPFVGALDADSERRLGLAAECFRKRAPERRGLAFELGLALVQGRFLDQKRSSLLPACEPASASPRA